MSSLENNRRNEIDRLINTDFNIRNHHPANLVTRDDLSTYKDWREHNITIRGKWMLHDESHKVETYILAHEFYKISLTHMFRIGFLRFRFYEWLCDMFMNLPDAHEFKILDSVEVRAEVDHLFTVDPNCRSYHKFEYHTPKPVELTFKLLLPDTKINAAIVKQITKKDMLEHCNTTKRFQLQTYEIHPSPEALPVAERIPWLYKFNIDRMTSQ